MYTRTAVLAWANRILDGNYTSFTEIPASELALLLYGIVNSGRCNGEAKGCFLSPVSLQEVQFPSQGDAAVPDTVRTRNTEHILALLRKASSEAAELLSRDATMPQLTVNDSLTAAVWLSGKAFVEELKIWRWVRALTEYRGVTEADVRREIQRFVVEGGRVSAAPGTATYEVPTAKTEDGTREDRRTSAPTPSREAAAAAGNKSMKRPRSSEGGDSNGRSIPTVPSLEGCTPVKEGETAEAEGAPLSTTKRQEHMPPYQKAEAQERMRPAVVGTAVVSSTSCYAVTDGEVPYDVESELIKHHKTFAAAFAQRCLAARENTPTTMKKENLSSSGASHRSVSNDTVFPPDFAAFGAVDEAERPQSCSTCPAVFALALEGNLQRIAKMENARKRAITACLKKDMTELLRAISEFA